MNKYLACVLILILISCTDYGSEKEYTQFTSDDLSFLYYDLDSLVYTGSSIQFLDTISYMFNGSDIFKVPVETKIESVSDPFLLSNSIEGESTLKLNKETGFRYVKVHISRQDKMDIGSYKIFYVGVDDRASYYCEFHNNDQIPLDTALVLGVHYENVLKIEPDSSSHSNIKLIYFAKRFGFIKIETLDGRFMERVSQ